MFWSTALSVTLRRQDFLQQISQGNAEFVAAMLQASPDLANKMHGSRFPLDVAVCCGLANIVQLLIDSGDLKHTQLALSSFRLLTVVVVADRRRCQCNQPIDARCAHAPAHCKHVRRALGIDPHPAASR